MYIDIIKHTYKVEIGLFSLNNVIRYNIKRLYIYMVYYKYKVVEVKFYKFINNYLYY